MIVLTGSHLAQTGLKVTIMHPPPECSIYRCVALCEQLQFFNYISVLPGYLSCIKSILFYFLVRKGIFFFEQETRIILFSMTLSVNCCSYKEYGRLLGVWPVYFERNFDVNMNVVNIF